MRNPSVATVEGPCQPEKNRFKSDPPAVGTIGVERGQTPPIDNNGKTVPVVRGLPACLPPSHLPHFGVAVHLQLERPGHLRGLRHLFTQDKNRITPRTVNHGATREMPRGGREGGRESAKTRDTCFVRGSVVSLTLEVLFSGNTPLLGIRVGSFLELAKKCFHQSARGRKKKKLKTGSVKRQTAFLGLLCHGAQNTYLVPAWYVNRMPFAFGSTHFCPSR